MFDPESIKVTEDETDSPEGFMDNFSEKYQQLNETLAVDKKEEVEDEKHPYPPLPKHHQDSSIYGNESPSSVGALEREGDTTLDSRETYSSTSVSRDEENFYSPVPRQYSDRSSSPPRNQSPPRAFEQESDDTSESRQTYSTSSVVSASRDEEVYSPLPRPSTKPHSFSNDSPPSTIVFEQENGIIQDSTESYSITSVSKDERTTQVTTLENSSDTQKEYNPENPERDEEVDYSDYDQGKQTYSQENNPFSVTKSLMNSMNGENLKKSTTTFPKFEDSEDETPSAVQDSDATIFPTLFQPTQSPTEYEDYEMVTSDYVSNLEPAERDTMFPRDHIKPWERKRGEKITTEGTKPTRPLMEFVHNKIKKVKDTENSVVENSSQYGRNE